MSESEDDKTLSARLQATAPALKAGASASGGAGTTTVPLYPLRELTKGHSKITGTPVEGEMRICQSCSLTDASLTVSLEAVWTVKSHA